MASFGKRGVAQPGSGGIRPNVGNQVQIDSEQLWLAIAVVRAGRLPAWTSAGPGALALGVLIITIIFWLCLLPFAGDLVRDHRLAGSWQPAYDMRAQDGHCKRYQLVATHCTAKIKSLSDPGHAAVDVGYLMGFTSGAGAFMIPVRSTMDPSVVTIAFAAETELRNRTITFLAFSGLLVFASLFFVRQLLTGRYRGGVAHMRLMEALQVVLARANPDAEPAVATAAR